MQLIASDQVRAGEATRGSVEAAFDAPELWYGDEIRLKDPFGRWLAATVVSENVTQRGAPCAFALTSSDRESTYDLPKSVPRDAALATFVGLLDGDCSKLFSPPWVK